MESEKSKNIVIPSVFGKLPQRKLQWGKVLGPLKLQQSRVSWKFKSICGKKVTGNKFILQ